MKNFIKENKISFNEGERNSSVTICIGYAQHLGVSKDDLRNELSRQIKKDVFIEKEIDRLWDYCDNKNYKLFWSNPDAKLQYKF